MSRSGSHRTEEEGTKDLEARRGKESTPPLVAEEGTEGIVDDKEGESYDQLVAPLGE